MVAPVDIPTYSVGGLPFLHTLSSIYYLSTFFFFFFLLFGAAPVAFGGSQARGGIIVAAADLCHSHSNVESELCL